MNLKNLGFEKLGGDTGAEIGGAVGGLFLGPVGAGLGTKILKNKKKYEYERSPGWRAFGGASIGVVPGFILGLLARKEKYATPLSKARILANLMKLTGSSLGGYLGARSAFPKKRKRKNYR